MVRNRLLYIYTERRRYRLSPPVMAGLDPAISYPHQIANDAIPGSNHPMVMAGTCLDMPRHDVVGPFRAVRQSLGPLELVSG